VDTSRAGNIANANIYFPLNDAIKLVKQAENVTSLYELEDRVRNLVFVKTDSSKTSKVSDRLKGILGEKTLVTTPKSFEDVLGTTFVLIDRFGLLVGFACLFIALLSLIRVVITGLAERKRDVGIMRAVGWRKIEVIRQLTLETLIVVVLGWMVGLLISLGVIQVLGFFKVSVPVPWELSPTPHFMAGGAEELSISVALQSQLNMTWVVMTFVLTVVISWFFSWRQARLLANLKSAEVLRSE
jgi:lipoprotein-releasing system permease protein